MTGRWAESRARGGAGYGLGVAGGADCLGRRVVELFLAYLLGDKVAGDFQQHGAGLAGAQPGIGLAHQLGNAVGVVNLGGPLGDAFVAAGGAEHRVDAQAVAGGAGRQQQDGDRVGISLGHTAKGVFRAGAGLHQENAGALAIVDSGKTVGHVDAGTLLAEYDGADAGYGGGLDKRAGGHAADEIHPLQLEYVGYCGYAVHGCVPPVEIVSADGKGK